MYQIYKDQEYAGVVTNENPEFDVFLPVDFLTRNGSVRIVAKDSSRCEFNKLLTPINSNMEARVGCISIKAKDFVEELPATNKHFNEWITLFDDIDDDEFDGEFGIDDEELPAIFAKLTLNPTDALRNQSQTPKATTGQSMGAPTSTMPATTKARAKRESMRSPYLDGGSPKNQ